MNLRVLVVGLTPEYYPSSVPRALGEYRTMMRSTNIGASFITRSILSIFEADYVDFIADVDISQIQNKYDVCIVSLASHLGPSRDISMLVGFLKKLDLRTVFLSGGLDAGAAAWTEQKVHQSVRELLDLCAVDNQWIGVRGPSSALYLHRQGIENVVPIGCPTMYSKPPIEVRPPNVTSDLDIAIPFHWSIAANLLNDLGDHHLIGQDCMDQELFLDGNDARISKKISKHLGISQGKVSEKLIKAISIKGYLPETYDDWYKEIGCQSALLSGRLHGAICGLTQGVPTVLSPWDLRIQEVVDYFALPNVSGKTVNTEGARAAFYSANFDKYNERQKICWGRWHEFVRQNRIAASNVEREHKSSKGVTFGECLRMDQELLSTASLVPFHEGMKRDRAFMDFVGGKAHQGGWLSHTLRRLHAISRDLVQSFMRKLGLG
jgi:hypothetical protein